MFRVHDCHRETLAVCANVFHFMGGALTYAMLGYFWADSDPV